MLQINKETIRDSFNVVIIKLDYEELCHMFTIGIISKAMMDYIDHSKDFNEFAILLEDKIHGTWRLVSRPKSDNQYEWTEIITYQFKDIYG